MRADMNKILGERSRGGVRVSFRGSEAFWRDTPLDERPRHESAKFRWHRSKRGVKWLSVNLAPLQRFLRSRIGRRWDDVYSEICQRKGGQSVAGRQIGEHLAHLVVTAPHELERYTTWHPRGWRAFLYVDPRTGVLREHKPRRDQAPPPEPDRLLIDDRVYRKVDDLWYGVELEPVLGCGPDAYDVMLREPVKNVSALRLHAEYGRQAYAARKRQLNTREIARIRKAIREQQQQQQQQ